MDVDVCGSTGKLVSNLMCENRIIEYRICYNTAARQWQCARVVWVALLPGSENAVIQVSS